MLRHDLHTDLLQGRKQRTIVCRILQVYQIMCLCTDRCELLLRCHARNILFIILRMHHILQRGHTDHKKLIQIRRCDAQKFQAF